MSLLLQLKLQGIRSFDPDTPAQIEFQTPLTVITGPNGAGKTTIIEALKYVTTGDLPPKSGVSGAFVYDPKLQDEVLVKAQVQLGFNAVNGNGVVIMRSLQAKTTASKTTVNSLEALLQVTDQATGDVASLNSRCAEMDYEIPIQLGVSPAIINNVIFCHQDESLWPLSEPSVLKKKFDDIFAATRYTKALSAIKDLRKKKSLEIKEDNAKLDHLKDNKEKAERISIQLEANQRRSASSEGQIQALDDQINDLSQEIEGLLETTRKFNALVAKLSERKREKEFLENSRNELSRDFVELYEPDEELQKQLEESRFNLTKNASTKQELERKKEKLSGELAELRARLSNIHTQQGKLQAEFETHQKRVHERDQLIQHICQNRDIQRFVNISLSARDIQNFMDTFNAQIRDQEHLLHTTKEEIRVQEYQVSASLQSLQSNITTWRNSIIHSRERIGACKQKIGSINNEIITVKTSKSEVDVLERQLREQELRLQESIENARNEDYQAKLNQYNDQQREVQNKIAELDEKISDLNLEVTNSAKLEIKKTERRNKNSSLETLLEARKDEFKSCLDQSFQLRTIEQAMDVKLREKQSEIKKHQQQYQKIQGEVSAIEAQINMENANLRKKRQEYQDTDKELNDKCQGRSPDEHLKELVEDLNAKRENLAQTTSASDLFSKYIETTKQKHACPLCRRPFEVDDYEKFLERLQSLVGGRVPERIERFQGEVTAAEEEVAKFRSLKPVQEKLEKLIAMEIPEIEKRIDSLTKNKDDKSREFEDVQLKIGALDMEASHMQELCKAAQEISRLNKDIESLDREINSLEINLSYTGSTKTLEELTSERESLQLKTKKISREIQVASQKKETRQREIQSRQEEVHEAKQTLLKMKYQLEQRERLEISKEELSKEINQLENEIADMEAKIRTHQPQVDGTQNTLDEIRRKGLERERAVEYELRKMQNWSSQLNNANNDIERFSSQGGAQRLSQSNDEIRLFESEISAKTKDEDNLTQEIRRIEKLSIESEKIERNIRDNVRYRELQRNIDQLDVQVQELEREIEPNVGSKYEDRLKTLQKTHEEYSSQRARLIGELTELREQTRRYQRELDRDYKDIKEKYRRQLINVKTAEMGLDDLDTYAQALDAAIMQYHSMKMIEINKFIHDLWNKTYQGNDIDRIEIRSDPEKLGKSYNYRVLMIKGNVELDMRGRCSAGQKVLAALIIRLALAETFCMNCGVIALDEPTTNLDQTNMRSLAQSLIGLINKRRAQRNFQLILITHDEDFVRLLHHSEYCDVFYRVEKNSQQSSIINAIPVNQL